jgi:hypothetical protein
MPLHSSATGAFLHEGKRQKEPVRVATIASITLAAPGATIDGISMSNGDRVLVKNQGVLSTNGIYIYQGASSAMTRSLDASAAVDFAFMFIVGVRQGTINAGTHWYFSNTATAIVTVGIDSISFTNLTTGIYSTEVSATDFAPSGLTGAANASRYVGAVNGAAPVTGSFNIGDYVVDRSFGGFWTCVVAGSPGTWRPNGGPAPIASRLFLAQSFI